MIPRDDSARADGDRTSNRAQAEVLAAAAAETPERWSRKGKIVLVIRLLNERGGGAERLFCEMANMFEQAGYEVTCLYCDSTRGRPFFPISPRVSVINLWHRAARTGAVYGAVDRLAKKLPRFRGRLVIDWLSKNLYFVRRLTAALKAIEPDVVISFLPPANTPSVIAARLAGVNVVPTNHNVPEQDFNSPARWDPNPVDRFLRLQVLKYATRVHVLLPGFREWFPDDIKRHTVAITNYVSQDFETVALPERRSKRIIGVGRLAPVKNYRVLIEAWALIAGRHPDWSLAVYGVGPEHEQLLDRVRALGLSSVELPGQIEDVKSAYLSAEIFCHPALYEGFGLSVAEALACGLPVVAFADCTGVNEFVRDQDNGLLVARAGGAEALAAALERLIEDDALRARLRVRAPESIRPFSLDAFRRNWIGLVEEVMAETGPG